MKIAIIFINIGSYHASRIRGFSKLCQQYDWELTAIQVTDDTLDHPWGNYIENLNTTIKTLISIADNPSNSRQKTFSSLADKLLINYLSDSVPDAVIIPGWSFSIARTTLRWCNQNNKISIVLSDSKEDDEPRIWWKEAIKSWLAKKYSSALVAGDIHKRYLIKLGFPEDAIFMGYDVVDNQVFHPDTIKHLSSPLDKPFFLSINRFVEKKNLPLLISAYSAYQRKLGKNAWNLVLCGDGELRPAIENLINQNQLQNNVHLPGFLQQDELFPYFAHAKCFIHASTTEQWGLVVNEAMAAGLPVIVSNRCGCFEDLVMEGVNGFGFNPENQQELTNLMLKVSSDEVDLKSMGQASLKHIQRYSPDYFAQGLKSAIEFAINKQQ
jgi:glycosyltransferase involved in cell wall biosynthesis